jgi:hypothetical protein
MITARFRGLVPLLALAGLAACSSDDPAPTGPTTPANGTLAITVTGLPTGTNAALTITGLQRHQHRHRDLRRRHHPHGGA